MAAGWPCMQILSFSKVKSQAYKNIGSRHRKMHSAVFNHFTGGIDFILLPLAPDQAQLLTGIFHYPVANTSGQSGHLTNSTLTPLPSSSEGLHKHKPFVMGCANPSTTAQELRLQLPGCLTDLQWGNGDIIYSSLVQLCPLGRPCCPQFAVAEPLIYIHSPTD